jgi:hypothetical protein
MNSQHLHAKQANMSASSEGRVQHILRDRYNILYVVFKPHTACPPSEIYMELWGKENSKTDQGQAVNGKQAWISRNAGTHLSMGAEPQPTAAANIPLRSMTVPP